MQIFTIGTSASEVASARTVPTASSFAGIVRSILSLHSRKLTGESLRYLVSQVETHRPDVVYFDSALTGRLAMAVRRASPTTRVVTFSHNVEAEFFCSAAAATCARVIELPAVIACEYSSVRASDQMVYLSAEDMTLAQKLYGLHEANVFPVTLDIDWQCIAGERDSLARASPPSVLFVGSPFFANLSAVRIVAENIAPRMPTVNFDVIGIGPKDLKGRLPRNVRLHGYVEDLTSYYSSAAAVVLPLYSGAGVRVKVAEALLHGVPVVATSLALRGYDCRAPGVVCCTTAHEFTVALKEILAFPMSAIEIAKGAARRHSKVTECELASTLRSF